MSESEQGILILVTGAALVSLPLHRVLDRFVVASVVSGVIASVRLGVIDTVRRGYPDSFWPIALAFGAFWGMLTSAVVGGVLRLTGYGPTRPSKGRGSPGPPDESESGQDNI